MAWGDGDENSNIERKLDDIGREVDYVRNVQMLNNMERNYPKTGPGGGGVLLLFLIMAGPLVFILHLLGVDDGSGFLSAIVSLCLGFYGLIAALFVWSLKNPITFVLISIPMIALIGCLLYLCWCVVSDSFENIALRRRARR
jgi:hypothetical protein